MERDKMFGFVSVDCSPLQLGFPYIRGWYNIIDWLGKPKGQVKITVKPDSPLSTFLPSTLPCQNMDDVIKTQTSFTAPSNVILQPVPPVDSEAESLSFMERALSNHLNDLNLLTNNLGKGTYIVNCS